MCQSHQLRIKSNNSEKGGKRNKLNSFREVSSCQNKVYLRCKWSTSPATSVSEASELEECGRRSLEEVEDKSAKVADFSFKLLDFSSGGR